MVQRPDLHVLLELQYQIIQEHVQVRAHVVLLVVYHLALFLLSLLVVHYLNFTTSYSILITIIPRFINFLIVNLHLQPFPAMELHPHNYQDPCRPKARLSQHPHFLCAVRRALQRILQRRLLPHYPSISFVIINKHIYRRDGLVRSSPRRPSCDSFL